MKDRISASPGRVLITPESGAAFYATMTRADNPTQEGDSLSKNTLLKDETAALFGLDGAALPDDILRVISRFQTGLGNEYLWAKVATQNNIVIEDTVSLYTIHSTTSNGTIQYASEIEISGNTVALVNPTTVTIGPSTNQSVLPTLVNKYIKSVDAFDTFDVVYCTAAKQGQYYVEGKAVIVSATGNVAGYVNSPNPNAYPPAVDDGFTYQALGMLGEKVRIATGSYVGTGGKSVSLSFGFTPKILRLWGTAQYFSAPQTTYTPQDIMWGIKRIGFGGSTSYNCDCSYSGNTITWTNANNAGAYALNASGRTYYYTAIG